MPIPWMSSAGSTPLLLREPTQSSFLSETLAGTEGVAGSWEPRPQRVGGGRVVIPGQGSSGFLEGQALRSPRGDRSEGRTGEPGAARVCVVGEKIPLLPTVRAWG